MVNALIMNVDSGMVAAEILQMTDLKTLSVSVCVCMKRRFSESMIVKRLVPYL